MTRIVLFLLLAGVGFAGAFFGAWAVDTAGACTYFSALALGLQWLFGEGA